MATIDAGNSSSTPLAAFGSFTGNTFNCSNFSTISATVESDTKCNLIIQHSIDGNTWIYQETVSVDAGIEQNIFTTVRCKFYRVIVNNFETAQTKLNLQSLLNMYKNTRSKVYAKGSNNDIELVCTDEGHLYVTATASEDSKALIKIYESTMIEIVEDLTAPIIGYYQIMPYTCAGYMTTSECVKSATALDVANNISIELRDLNGKPISFQIDVKIPKGVYTRGQMARLFNSFTKSINRDGLPNSAVRFYWKNTNYRLAANVELGLQSIEGIIEIAVEDNTFITNTVDGFKFKFPQFLKNIFSNQGETVLLPAICKSRII